MAPMIRGTVDGTALAAKPTLSDSYRVGTALAEFILALLTVSDKVKAGAELIKVLGEVATEAVWGNQPGTSS